MLAINLNVPVIEREVDFQNIPIFGFDQSSINQLIQANQPSVEIDVIPELLGEIIGNTDRQVLKEQRYKDYLNILNSFLTSLQNSGLPRPEIVGNIKDLISFEWRSSKGNEFVVTLKPDNSLIYSGVFNEGNVCGTENFFGKKIPTSISTHILKSA